MLLSNSLAHLVRSLLLLTSCVALTVIVGCEPGVTTERTVTKTTTVAPIPAEDKPDLGVSSSVPPSVEVETTKQTTTESGSSVTSADVQEEAGEAWDASSKFAAKTRDEFVAEAKVRLAKMDQKIQEWGKSAQESTPEAKAKYETAKQRLVVQREKLDAELQRLGEASSEAWTDLSAGASAAWDEMSAAFRDAATHFHRD